MHIYGVYGASEHRMNYDAIWIRLLGARWLPTLEQVGLGTILLPLVSGHKKLYKINGFGSLQI